MLAIILGLAGAVLGAMAGGDEGFVFGGAFGALAGLVWPLRGRVERLERELTDLKQQLHIASIDDNRRVEQLAKQLEAIAAMQPVAAQDQAVPISPVAAAQSVLSQVAEPAVPAGNVEPPTGAALESSAAPPAVDPPPPLEPLAEPQSLAELQPLAEELPVAAPPLEPPPVDPQPQPPPPLPPLDAAIDYARAWLFGGNTVVRAGVLVLLVGVALLVRYAAEHSKFPIELRMASAAAIGFGLVFTGYRQRLVRPGFGQTLQGGGIAAMYLVVFFSFRTYELLPPGLAFALLVGIAISSGALAVAQDAIALVVIGQIGGFMAPVLASSGSGNHVALFSYYMLLNLLTFAVAWVKPWRALNLIGFVFTFGIGSTWGALRYEPEHFATTEPFLIAFFALYTAIPVVFALKKSLPGSPLRGWVDGSLVFGTPLATLLLQYAMVKDTPFAMAYSTLALAIVYVGLSRFLHRRAPEALRAMIEAFLAIGVGFATLAVPYGLDNHNLTGATWALEGAGLYWLGVRQERWISRLAGALLPAAGLVAYLYDLDAWGLESWPLANTVFVAGLLVGLGCLFIARHAHAHREALPNLEWLVMQLYLVAGLCVINAVGLREIDAHVADDQQAGAGLAWIALIALALELMGKPLSWLPARALATLIAPALFWALLIWAFDFEQHPLGRAGWLGFPLALSALALSTRRLPQNWAPARYLHAPQLWAFAFTLALEAGFLVADFARLREEWSVLAGTLVVAAALVLAVARARESTYREVYLGPACGALALLVLLHSAIMTGTMTGEATPLPYVPLANPVDLALAACFFAFARWARELRAGAATLTLLDPGMLGLLYPLLGCAMFFAWNGLLARAVHHYAGVAFDPEELWRSTPLQAAMSISWSVLGLGATALASKRGLRAIWILGAVLLGVVVVKLFTIDLVRLSTVAKIATFLVVGLLLVLVGYFAPVPPAAEDRQPEGA